MTILLNEDAAPRRRVVRLLPAPAPMPQPEPLKARAALLWPDSERNQAEWLRAVAVVRATSRGWMCERRVDRLERPL